MGASLSASGRVTWVRKVSSLEGSLLGKVSWLKGPSFLDVFLHPFLPPSGLLLHFLRGKLVYWVGGQEEGDWTLWGKFSCLSGKGGKRFGSGAN